MPVPNHSQRYGGAHRQVRAELVRQYEADGRGWRCALCRTVMWEHPSLLDLAHDPDDAGYSGLAHRRCNRGYGQAESNQRRAAKDPPCRPRTRW